MGRRYCRWMFALLLGCFLAATAWTRTWTDSQGREKEGAYIDFQEGVVQIKSSRSGNVFKVPLEKLSKADQSYVQSRVRAEASEDTEDSGWAPGNGGSDEGEEGGSEGAVAHILRTGVNLTALIVLALLNIPLYVFWGKLMFGGWGEFFEAVKFWLTPDAFSFFRGEWGEDRMAEFKLGFFIFWCGLTVVAQYVAVHALFFT